MANTAEAHVTFGRDPDTYHRFVGSQVTNSGSFSDDILAIVVKVFRAYFFGECIDFGPYTITKFEKNVQYVNSYGTSGFTKVNPIYPDGTWVFRASGKYSESRKVTNLISTADTLTVETDGGTFMFTGIRQFVRKKRHEFEPTQHKTLLGTEMTTWSLSERSVDLVAIVSR